MSDKLTVIIESLQTQMLGNPGAETLEIDRSDAELVIRQLRLKEFYEALYVTAKRENERMLEALKMIADGRDCDSLKIDFFQDLAK
jgi:hypothetical protein